MTKMSAFLTTPSFRLYFIHAKLQVQTVSRQESIETCVIGAGPKGLAAAVHLSGAYGLHVVNFDIHGPGANWRRNRMNPRLALNPAGHEIVTNAQYSFQNFWDNYYPTSKKKKNPLHNGCYTATHYRHYLEWLDMHAPSQQGNVTDIIYDNDKKQFAVEVFTANNTHQVVKTQSVIIASGLIGYGGIEFVRDPTTIHGESTRIKHMPKDLRTDSDTLDFLFPGKEIAVIGAGNSAAALFWMAQKAPWIEKIHLFTSGSLDDEHDPNSLIARVPNFNYQRIMQESRAVFHPQTVIMGAREEGDSVVLSTDDDTEFTVDKAVITAGYRYDFTQIPFTRGLRNQKLVSVEGRYPKINKHHQILGNDGAIEVYMIGEGAVTLGKEQRLLFSTAPSVQTITDSILDHLGDAGK